MAKTQRSREFLPNLRVLYWNVSITLGLLLGLEGVSRLIHAVDFPDPLIVERVDDWGVTRQFDPVLFWRIQPRAEWGLDGSRSRLVK